jgi:hypothetical protein
MKAGDRFMQTCATNTDRARIVRSVLALAVVGTLLLATLVPLPGLHGRLKNAASPTVALRNWERRQRVRSITWAEAVLAAQQVRAKGIGFVSSADVLEIDNTTSDEASSGKEDGNLDTDQQPDDASRP